MKTMHMMLAVALCAGCNANRTAGAESSVRAAPGSGDTKSAVLPATLLNQTRSMGSEPVQGPRGDARSRVRQAAQRG